MDNAPFVVEGSKKKEKVKSSRGLVTVNGHYTPEGLTYKGKRIRSGIFVNVTGLTEKEKQEAFDLAKQEIGHEAKEPDVYEVIDL